MRFDRDAAIGLLDDVNTLFVAKGKKVTLVDLAGDRPDDDALAALIMGPSGNLRAPTLRAGDRMAVGFNPEMYDEFLA